MMRHGALALTAAGLIACSGGGDADRPTEETAAPDTAGMHEGHVMPPSGSQDTSRTADDTAVSVMDHSGMDMGPGPAPQTAGADPHANMPGMQRPGAAAAADPHGNMPGMQRPGAPAAADPHANMPGMQRPGAPAAAEPHANMPGMQRPSAAAAADPHANMPGMQRPGAAAAADPHANMPGMQPAPAAAASATARLHALAAALLEDPVVQETLQKDTALLRRWRDPAVRRVLTQTVPR